MSEAPRYEGYSAGETYLIIYKAEGKEERGVEVPPGAAGKGAASWASMRERHSRVACSLDDQGERATEWWLLECGTWAWVPGEGGSERKQ